MNMTSFQNNAFRSACDLGGVWQIGFDPEGRGEALGWASGLDPADCLAIALPGSWNEQLAEAGYMNYVGDAWFETRFFVPAVTKDQSLFLHFGSADYHADVWVNGQHAGRSRAAMLPFECPIYGLVEPGTEAVLVVRVNATLDPSGPTQGITAQTYQDQNRPRDEYLPAVRFDFFPFGGLNRPIYLVQRPRLGISDYRATADLTGVHIAVESGGGVRLSAKLVGNGETVEAEGDCLTALRLSPKAPRLWSPDDPFLYRLDIILHDAEGRAIDSVSQRIGLREFAVQGTQLLLNGKPIQLKGFGKHEESPLHGRGLNLPQLVKDFNLLKWIGANSVRTSHYPYSEEFLDLADQFGILVIDEVFSINLDFRLVNETTLANHKTAISELIARDKNRTCVVAWSLSNEPGYLAEAEYREKSGPYWKAIFAHARSLDSTRPMIHANVGYAGNDDPAFAESDFLGINRYHGWYSEPAQLDRATARLRGDFDTIAAHGKPIVVLEFGADAMAGQHASYDQMFTEEYQANFITAYWREIDAHPSVAGGHIWNFADFRTAQHGRRVVHNLKGIFTRTREPKMAAWKVKELWRDDA
jgi:beta-glucuronidase